MSIETTWRSMWFTQHMDLQLLFCHFMSVMMTNAQHSMFFRMECHGSGKEPRTTWRLRLQTLWVLRSQLGRLEPQWPLHSDSTFLFMFAGILLVYGEYLQHGVGSSMRGTARFIGYSVMIMTVFMFHSRISASETTYFGLKFIFQGEWPMIRNKQWSYHAMSWHVQTTTYQCESDQLKDSQTYIILTTSHLTATLQPTIHGHNQSSTL